MTLYALCTWFPEDFTGMSGVLRAERPGWSFQNLERIWRAMTAVEHDGRGIFLFHLAAKVADKKQNILQKEIYNLQY